MNQTPRAGAMELSSLTERSNQNSILDDCRRTDRQTFSQAVTLKPRIGAYVVAAWLCGIIINLHLLSGYYDVALRDFGLSLGALALGRLSVVFE